jgi:purine-binding chemotaxis protein CheW
MIDGDAEVASKATALRDAFDRSFAEPPPAAPEASTDLLGIRIGVTSYALDLSEIVAVFADRRIVPLPSAAHGFLGVATLRGDVVPVYGLGSLLGHAGADEQPRWLVLAGRGPFAAFAFDAVEGHVRLSGADIAPVQSQAQAPTQPAPGHVRASALVDGTPRPIIGIRALMDHLEHHTGQHGDRRGN